MRSWLLLMEGRQTARYDRGRPPAGQTVDVLRGVPRVQPRGRPAFKNYQGRISEGSQEASGDTSIIDRHREKSRSESLTYPPAGGMPESHFEVPYLTRETLNPADYSC